MLLYCKKLSITTIELSILKLGFPNYCWYIVLKNNVNVKHKFQRSHSQFSRLHFAISNLNITIDTRLQFQQIITHIDKIRKKILWHGVGVMATNYNTPDFNFNFTRLWSWRSSWRPRSGTVVWILGVGITQLAYG